MEVAAYYFPNYHNDPRNDKWHGAGWNEWELVKAACPRFAGHNQPKVPMWGYENEADPAVMAKKIDAAADHALSAFLFDWYWYEDGPYLNRALDEGFLHAPNNERLKFALMWANHDWVDIHPAARNGERTLLAGGEVSEAAFFAAARHMITHYFCHPSYLRVNGGLYLSFYMIAGLVAGLGGVEQTRAALSRLRDMVREAGLGELHLNAVVWCEQILPGEKQAADVNVLLPALGFDSISSYVWIHHDTMEHFPETDYAAFRELCEKRWPQYAQEYTLPYFPNVTVGWDPSPRTIQTDRYDNLGYPFTSILRDNTPAEFEKALMHCKQFVQTNHVPLITINAWNEWTEGSYLEPDTQTGYGYLEAIRTVFGKEAGV